MATAIALLGFNGLGRSVTPTFLFRSWFCFQLSLHCPNMNKKSIWEGQKNSRFLSAIHRIMSSCGCKAREIVVAKCELVLWGTSPVDKIRLIGPFKPCLAENSSLQSSNCNILGLAATVALTSPTKSPNYSDLGVLPGMFSPKRSRWPPIFLHFWHH